MSRISEVGKAFAKELKRFLADKVPGVTVAYTRRPRADDGKFQEWIDSHKSMGIYVAPIRFDSKLESRKTNQDTYSFIVYFLESCKDLTVEASTIDDWCEDREDVVEAAHNFYGDIRNQWRAEGVGPLRAVESEVTEVCDPDMLIDNDVFMSAWELTFSERVNAAA